MWDMPLFVGTKHVPDGFDRRAGSDVKRSHVFPQGVLAAVT